eukprot:2521305-Ditylum_brightwellii.AAC.1
MSRFIDNVYEIQVEFCGNDFFVLTTQNRMYPKKNKLYLLKNMFFGESSNAMVLSTVRATYYQCYTVHT